MIRLLCLLAAKILGCQGKQQVEEKQQAHRREVWQAFAIVWLVSANDQLAA
jgi:hypothetical protein